MPHMWPSISHRHKNDINVSDLTLIVGYMWRKLRHGGGAVGSHRLWPAEIFPKKVIDRERVAFLFLRGDGLKLIRLCYLLRKFVSLGRGLGKNNWIAFITSFGKMEKRKFNFKLLNWASNLKDTNLKMCHVLPQMSLVRTCNKFSAARPYFDISEGVVTFFFQRSSVNSECVKFSRLWKVLTDFWHRGHRDDLAQSTAGNDLLKDDVPYLLRLVQTTRTLTCRYPFPMSSCPILVFPLELKPSLYPYLP